MSSARDHRRPLTNAVPLRCPDPLAVRAGTSSDISGHLAGREPATARISGRLEIRRGGFAVRICAFGGHLGAFWPSARLCVECVPGFDGRHVGAL